MDGVIHGLDAFVDGQYVIDGKEMHDGICAPKSKFARSGASKALETDTPKTGNRGQGPMDPARTIVAAVMLLGAAIYDVRERRVPNRYWFPYVAFAAVFLALDMAEGHWFDLLGAIVVALLAYLFWHFGLWGGADAKGVMILAFLVREHLRGPTTVAVLDTLVAGMLLVLLWPIALTALNVAHRRFAFPAMLIGGVVPIEVAKARRVWPLQDVHGWRYRPRIGEDLTQVYRELEKEGRTEVWVTPQLPLLAFIALGFLLVSFFGSPIAWIAVLAGP